MINKQFLIAAVIGASITGAPSTGRAADPSLCRPYAAATTQMVLKFSWLKAYTSCVNDDATPVIPRTMQDAWNIVLDDRLLDRPVRQAPPSPYVEADDADIPPGSVPASGPVRKSVPKGEPLCVKHGMKTIYNGLHWRCVK